MKKILALVCVLSLLLAAMASCNLDHEHKFSDELRSDSDYHWNPCTVEDGCTEQGNRAAHDFEPEIDKDGKSFNVCKVCGYKNDRVNTAPEHTHEYGTEYKFSENFHWFECTTEGCFEISKNREHQFDSPETTYSEGKLTITYTCVDCGYKKVEVSTVDAEVDSVTEWDALFGNFNLTNFTMDVYITGEGETQNNHCIVTEYGLYYHIPDAIEMYIVKVDGTWVGYELEEWDEDSKFEIIEGTQEELAEMCADYSRETIVQISFADNFEKFTYNPADGTYTCAEKITATYYNNDGEIAGELYCFNNVVKVADGKILHISCEYNFGEEDYHDEYTYSFIYDNIGLSEVSIPQSVIDEANANG